MLKIQKTDEDGKYSLEVSRITFLVRSTFLILIELYIFLNMIWEIAGYQMDVMNNFLAPFRWLNLEVK